MGAIKGQSYEGWEMHIHMPLWETPVTFVPAGGIRELWWTIPVSKEICTRCDFALAGLIKHFTWQVVCVSTWNYQSCSFCCKYLLCVRVCLRACVPHEELSKLWQQCTLLSHRKGYIASVWTEIGKQDNFVTSQISLNCDSPKKHSTVVAARWCWSLVWICALLKLCRWLENLNEFKLI